MTAAAERLPTSEINHPKVNGKLEPELKPRLLIDSANPDRTVTALRDILAKCSLLFDRGFPVRLALDQTQRSIVAQLLTPHGLVRLVHSVCRPYLLRKKKDGPVTEVDARLPLDIARMYLDWRGEWHLPPLNGIASTPLLRGDGVMFCREGYDRVSGIWLESWSEGVVEIAERPSTDDAVQALALLRATFKTFCFGDAETIYEEKSGNTVVDLSQPPAQDESAFLTSLLTAVCRPSLHLAPGFLFSAAPISGAGVGKGLLARCICLIAFGKQPNAVTAGIRNEEMEKRVGAELLMGSSVLFIDNLNSRSLKSDLLASAITERPSRIRILGKSEMLPLNASAMIILTGNGVSVSEDLARRFITIELDPKMENPEARSFKVDIQSEVLERRAELLAALLTIWRWGRITPGLKAGRTLGSFERWGQWVRDPLLALGCKDCVERTYSAKASDIRRQSIAELFEIWWIRHHEKPIVIRNLDGDVKAIADPQGRGRQYLSSRLERLTGTRVAGYVLTRQPAAGKWGATSYALKKTGAAETHRGHRDHPNATNQMPPMPPMPSQGAGTKALQREEQRQWRKQI